MALFDWLKGGDRPAQVDDAFADLQEMLRIGDEMFGAACGHLLDNEILDLDLERRDDEIDRREGHLRAAVQAYLASQPGRPQVYALKLLGIVQEAERIGDLSKSLGDLASLATRPRLGPAVLPLRNARNEIQAMFTLTRSCFRENDVTRAEAVLTLHEERKREIQSIIRDLATGRSDSVNEAVVLALAARMLGRVSSHLANIASSVVFPFEQIRRTHVEVRDRIDKPD